MAQHKLVVVGMGQALQVHYAKVLATMGQFDIVHLVDPSVRKADVVSAVPTFGEKIKTASWSEAVSGGGYTDVIALVLTPDHYATVESLAKAGCTRLIVEKPLVSRAKEIAKLDELIQEYQLQIYAIDFYIPKLFGWQVVSGRMKADDPRRSWIKETPLGGLANGNFALDGISVTVLESGSFCLQDVAGRPWLERDSAVGGMLRDLGTHVFAPLVSSGVMSEHAKVEFASLGKINDGRDGIRKLEPGEVEMYISALLSDGGVPISTTFGKVPFEKNGMWSLSLRGKDHQMFYAGLRTGQPSLLITKEGQVRYDLVRSTYEIVLEEALLYFEDKLPGFDGNVGALLSSLRLIERIRESYK